MTLADLIRAQRGAHPEDGQCAKCALGTELDWWISKHPGVVATILESVLDLTEQVTVTAADVAAVGVMLNAEVQP